MLHFGPINPQVLKIEDAGPRVGKLSVLHYPKWGVWAFMDIRNSKAALKVGLEMSGNIFRNLDVIRNPTLLASRNACCTRG